MTMRESPDLLERVRQTNRRHTLFSQGMRILIAYSGGADSTTLLHLLVRLRQEMGFTLEAAHVNHGIRGADAEKDARAAQALSQSLGVPCAILKADVPALRQSLRASLQEAARIARHTALREYAKKQNLERIALGHTESDRIETILFHILRGTGTEGLIGFPAVHAPIIRPLYEIRREETQNYCRQYRLEVCEDASNESLAYQRNRTRLQLLPEIRKRYNPEADKALLRLSEIARADNEALAEMTETAYQNLLAPNSGETLRLHAPAWRSLPLALQRRTLRRALQSQMGDLHNLTFEATETLIRALNAKESGKTTLSATGISPLCIQYSAQWLHISPVSAPASPAAWRVPLQIPGETPLPDIRAILDARLFAKGTPCPPPFVEKTGSDLQTPRAHGLTLPYSEITPPLVVRSWLPGDRMRPRHLGGGKKLQDLFTDAKIPITKRRLYPVLVDSGGSGRIWAVFGLRLGEGASPCEIEQEQRCEYDTLRLSLRSDHDA